MSNFSISRNAFWALILALLALGILGWTRYLNLKNICNGNETTRHSYTHADSVAFHVIPPAVIPGGHCETCVQAPYLGPFDFSGPDAVKMVANYTADHWEDINTATSGNVKDSRCVWFSLSRLKGFIQAIENSAISKLPGCCCNLGIRIYFAEYDTPLVNKFQDETKNNPPALQFNPLPGEHYEDKTTVILVPTYQWTVDGTNHDFNPFDPGLACNTTQHDSSWHGTIMALAMDHASIVPPPYPSQFCQSYMKSGADFMIHGVDVVQSGNSPNLHYNDNPVPVPPGEAD